MCRSAIPRRSPGPNLTNARTEPNLQHACAVATALGPHRH